MAGQTIKLNSGYNCPLLGYGTWQSTDEEQLKTGIKTAIDAGYRHIDTAHVYSNEYVIGETLQELIKAEVVKREDIFLTTKIFGTHFKPNLVVPQLKTQLSKLKTSYVDLYLIHFPVALQPPETGSNLALRFDKNGNIALDDETKLEETWAALEKCVELGLARSIGVSNCNISQVERLLKSKIKPTMNQVESHPAFQNTKLIEFCHQNDVAVTAFSCLGTPGSKSTDGQPLNRGNLLEDERLINIGKKYGKNAAQVMLRWQIQRNVVVIPKSLTPSRIKENADVWNFTLSNEDMVEITKMDLNQRWLDLSARMPDIRGHSEFPFTTDGNSC